MSSDAITEKEQRLQDVPLEGGIRFTSQSGGPSLLREDDPALARLVGMVGGTATIIGGMALGFNLLGKSMLVGTGWALILVALGLAAILFHAAFDRDSSVRTFYLAVGLLTMLLGAVLVLLPYPNAVGDQFRWAVPCLILALFFLLAVLRNETIEFNRNLAQMVLTVAGGLFVVVGLGYGNIKAPFLMPYGMVLALIGLTYLAGFIGSRGISDDRAFVVGLAIGGVGLFVLLVGLVRALLPGGTFGSLSFVPYGFTLTLVGLTFVLTAVGLCSDAPLVVLTRRELGAFFYSPIAYLCLFGFGVVSYTGYYIFLMQFTGREGGGLFEPIVRNYFIAFFPVITVVFVVPVLTMRLLSEEQRSGTLEVLLTAPVDEFVVVASKFLAGFLTYLVLWAPFGLYLMAIPLSGGNPFDYYPLLSFFVGLCVTGAGFISMGLFFSSLTSSQIASGVLTFAGMLGLTAIALHRWWFPSAGALQTVFTHMSYLEVWDSTLEGKLVPRYLLGYLSLTVLFLFMTVKVLESRKWR
jgi:hypothetical protein